MVKSIPLQCEDHLYSKFKLYDALKKVRYSQVFSGFQKVAPEEKRIQDLKNAPNFDQAQVVQDVIDYLDFDVQAKERQILRNKQLEKQQQRQNNASTIVKPSVNLPSIIKHDQRPAFDQSILSPRIQRMIKPPSDSLNQKRAKALFPSSKSQKKK